MTHWKEALLLCGALMLVSWTDAAAQTNCPAANPNDFVPDHQEINNCLAAGGRVELEDGWPGYWIGGTLNLNVNGTVLTKGSLNRPTLLATDDLFGPMLRVGNTVTNYEISYLIFGGRVYSRIYRNQCNVDHRDFGSNLLLRGSWFNVTSVDSAGAMCGTAMEISGSNFNITGNNVYLNGIPEDEPGASQRWADGITLLRCDSGYVANNTVENNTDIDIVVGGGAGCTIENNTIRNTTKHGFAGIHVGWFQESAGNHSGNNYRNNTIFSETDKLAFGIIVGYHPWDVFLDIPNSGITTANNSSGTVVNLAVDGPLAGTVTGNTFSGARGTYGFGCNIAADYSAADFGSTSIQGGWTFRQYHNGTCTP